MYPGDPGRTDPLNDESRGHPGAGGGVHEPVELENAPWQNTRSAPGHSRVPCAYRSRVRPCWTVPPASEHSYDNRLGRGLGELTWPSAPNPAHSAIRATELDLCTMKTLATTLYPFVPSGGRSGVARFFAALGFETTWRQDGLAGLRCGGALPSARHRRAGVAEESDGRVRGRGPGRLLGGAGAARPARPVPRREARAADRVPLGPRNSHHRIRPASAGTCGRQRGAS